MSQKSLGKNYIPGSMGFAEGMMGPKGDVGYIMMFSMKKAKKIVKTLSIKTIDNIDAGLNGDWVENHCIIYDKDGWHDYDAWGGSQWATPLIIVNYKNKPSETFECWFKKEKP